MDTDAGREIYKERASTVECVNGHLRNRGFRQFPTRGLEKAKAVLPWHALAHDLLRTLSLACGPSPNPVGAGSGA